jgi:hypothetical protein
MAGFFMRARMGRMKRLLVRRSLLLIVIAAQLFVIFGCMAKYRAADTQVEAMDKRMKQIEKDAADTNSPGRRRDVEAKSAEE